MVTVKSDAEFKKMVSNVLELLEAVISDRGVPRNIRGQVEEAKKKIEVNSDDPVNYGSAIYFLDDISNDINMPSHTRTEIWTLISQLEAIKEKLK